MTEPTEQRLRDAFDQVAADTVDPAGRLPQVRGRARRIRRRRVAGGGAALATALVLSGSALAGLLPAGDAPPAAPRPAGTTAGPPVPSPAPLPPLSPGPATPSERPERPARPGLPVVTATAAEAVLDSIGVTVHLDAGPDDATVVSRLRAAGIRYVRTEAVPLYSGTADCGSPALRRRRALTDAGIRLDLVVGLTSNLAALRPTVECLGGPRSIASFEGQNEPDRYVGGDWVRQTRAGQRALHQAVKADPGLAGIPVLAPSPSTSDALGSVADHADLANAHPFQASYAELDRALTRARLVAPGRPVVATDVGWSNATVRPPGRSTAVPASEREVAAELPRMLLDNARRGIVRTYVYSLADDRDDPGRTDLEAGFGLLRHDGTPKPAYAALTALVDALRGSGGDRRGPGRLAYRLDGRTDGLGHLLLQCGDGSFVLALWGPPGDRGGRPVRLTLASPATVELIEPAGGPAVTAGPARSFDLRTARGPLLVRIRA